MKGEEKMKKTGSISGLVVFFVGIALLILTFVFAFLTFTNPERIADFKNLIPASGGEYEGLIKAVGYVVAIGLLLVMGFVGGKIAGYGIGMYRARPSTESDNEPDSKANA